MSFVLLASSLLSLESCLNDDTESTYYDDTAITAFSLTSVSEHLKSYKGNDSVATYTCSTVKFYIDQLKHEIYNVDSLDAGLDSATVRSLVSISTKNNGVLIYQALDDTLKYNYFSSTDSIDFSKPRHFRVYSTSGQYFQDYTIRINVHKEVADSFQWRANAYYADLEQMTGMKGIQMGDSVFIFGKKDAGTVVLCGNKNNVAGFTLHTLALEQSAISSMVKYDGFLYTINGGNVVRTANVLADYETVASAAQLKQLVGATDKNIYAITNDSNIVVSRDGGVTWNMEQLDTDGGYLPSTDISFMHQTVLTNSDMERIYLVGNSDANKNHAVVWNKVVNYSNDNYLWQYLEISPDNNYQAPREDGFKCVLYNDSIEGFDGETLYKSRDQGLTWYTDDMITMPADFVSNKQNYGFFVDEDKFMWLIANGKVWKGRRNELGWK